MKVVVAYCQLDPVIREVLERDGIAARYCDTSGDPEAYWRLLCELWAEGETWVHLEQDKIPEPGAIQAIFDCPNPWCAYPFPMQGGGYHDAAVLGCGKFHASLMERFPKLMLEKVGELGIGGGDIPPRHWQRLDMAIALWLHLSLGQGVCWHPRGMVRHEHYLEV